MRSKKCIKFLIFSITCLLCLNFSSNANAITFSQNVTATGNMWSVGDKGRLQLLDNTILSADQYGKVNIPQYPANYANIRGIYRDGNIDVQEGYYYTFIIGSRTSSSNTAFTWRNLWNESSDFSVVGVEDIDTSPMTLYDFCVKFRVSNSVYQCEQASADQFSHVTKLAQVWMRANVSGSKQFRFGGSTNGNVLQVLAPDFLIGDIFEYNPTSPEQEMNDKDNEDRDNLESQSSQTDSDSSDSQDEANSTGTTLLGAFSGFVSALTSATPSNCSIDMDLGNLDMGNVDFCELDPPAGFSAIGSVLMILFCVPLSISTARKVISLFRSFQ